MSTYLSPFLNFIRGLVKGIRPPIQLYYSCRWEDERREHQKSEKENGKPFINMAKPTNVLFLHVIV